MRDVYAIPPSIVKRQGHSRRVYAVLRGFSITSPSAVLFDPRRAREMAWARLAPKLIKRSLDFDGLATAAELRAASTDLLNEISGDSAKNSAAPART